MAACRWWLAVRPRLVPQSLLAEHQVVDGPQDGLVLDEVKQDALLGAFRQSAKRCLRLEDGVAQ